MATSVFITGATGFVGRHLTRLLADEGLDVFGACFPEKPCPTDTNIVHLDLRSRPAALEAIKRTQTDWIVHLAAVSNVRQSWDKREETLQTNLMGTFHLLESVRAASPCARLLFISSSDVYGSLPPGEKSFREDDAVHIVNPYAFTKAAGELLCRFYVQVEKLDIIVARPFPHTGPGQTASFVFSDWASQLVRIERGQARPALKVGNLDVRRDYSDVRDTVRAYRLLLDKGRSGETYNVCSGTTVSLRDALETLLSFSAARIEVVQDPEKLRKTDIPFLGGDNAKLRAETGWQAEIPLRQTLLDLLEFWRSQP